MLKADLLLKLEIIILAVIIMLTALAASAVSAATPTGLEIIPKPALMETKVGSFRIETTTVIAVPGKSDELTEIGRYLSDEIRKLSGYTLEVRSSDAPGTNAIILAQGARDKGLGDEGYTLEVTGSGVTVTAPKPAGVFYGIQTLRQILMSTGRNNTTANTVPCVYIEDKPSFSWRGMQLDCSRHFLSLDYVKRYIDLLAYHKLNIFHWHLTDDQGWRLEIKRYPKLTEIGAWRGEGQFRHGGYFTQEEAKEVVEYAAKRYITVVPEIEMPGHATAAIAAYPELSCEKKQIDVETIWGIHINLFCAGRESTFMFLENVLREVCDIFPSEYIHIGGDEAKKDKWEACPDCQKRIKELGIKDESELQGYFTRRIDEYVRKLGRSIVGWDEILEGNPSNTAIVQSWRGNEGAIEGSKKGHYVISSPYTHVYLDFPNIDEGIHDTGWLRVTTLEKTYSFNPIPNELTEKEAKFILGGEAPLWSERTPQPEVDNNVFPRLCALSEAVWTPADLKNWEDFSARMDVHYERMDELGIDYFKKSAVIGIWGAGQVTASAETIDWDITQYMTEPGHKRITFRHDDGESNIVIEWTAILEDGEEIARDEHEGLTGKRDKAHSYRLRIHAVKPGATYTLKAKMRTDSGAGSKGSVLLRNFRP